MVNPTSTGFKNYNHIERAKKWREGSESGQISAAIVELYSSSSFSESSRARRDPFAGGKVTTVTFSRKDYGSKITELPQTFTFLPPLSPNNSNVINSITSASHNSSSSDDNDTPWDNSSPNGNSFRHNSP